MLPIKHEVFTHLWLETIASNAERLSDLILVVLESPHIFNAGWDGADWKSFADAASGAIPHLPTSKATLVEDEILSHEPELDGAREFSRRLKAKGDSEPWPTRGAVIAYLNRSGHEQRCILERVGFDHLSDAAKRRLTELRRKFRETAIPEPHHNDAHWVQSPIKREQALRMTDAQWLRAIKRYHSDEDRRRGRTFTDGGASQLAGELQHLAKEQPARFAMLVDQIPDDAHHAYLTHLLWGLAEAVELEDNILCRVIVNAHARPTHPYGSDIARLIQKQPRVANDPAIFDILIWYVEHGEANSDDDVDSSSTEREVMTIEDLLNSADRLHLRGLNGARGWAAEALGNVLWEAPDTIDKAWHILERRAAGELLLSVRCCLIRPIVPLFRDNRERCAALVERVSRSPANATRSRPTLLEIAWLWFAFPAERLPQLVRRALVWCAVHIEHLVRGRGGPRSKPDEAKSWSPLLTHQRVYLIPFLLQSVPRIGKRLIYRLVVSGDATSRMIGAWHVFRRSFQDPEYAPLADALAGDGVVYRRLVAQIASHAVTADEYRHRAENVLRTTFNDDDKQVRHQAADVFRNIKPDEFIRYRALAEQYLNSKAFEADSWAFFHALDEAECKVDDIVVPATERLIVDIERNGNAAGRRSMDLHLLQDIIKKEYVASESDPPLRRRLLDLIDDMLRLELYGVDTIIKAHER